MLGSQAGTSAPTDHSHIGAEHVDHVAGYAHAGEYSQILLRRGLPLTTLPFIGHRPRNEMPLQPSRASAVRRYSHDL